MTSRGYIMFVGEDDQTPWRVARTSGDAPPVDVEPTPGSVAAALRQMGYRGEGIVLAVPASWCMTATIDVTQTGARDRNAMTYLLEEHLPLAAESVVADFLVRGGRALAVCARLGSVRGAIAALESEGLVVRAVAPAALLAAQDLARGGEAEQVLSLAEGSNVNLIAMRDGIATSWVIATAAHPRDVALQLEVISLDLDKPPPLREFPAAAVEQAAGRQAQRVLDGREVAWGEMRRGLLAPADRLRGHRKALNAALAAAAVLLLACSGAMLWRADQYDRKARASEAALAADFQRAFPGWAVPTNVKTVVESEHRKALAHAREAGGGRLRRSAIRTLHDVLAQLPVDERWAIQRMAFDEGSFEIEGRLRAVESLDRFAAAVRRSGLNVAPPESHRGAGGLWNFSIRGVQPAATASASARAGHD